MIRGPGLAKVWLPSLLPGLVLLSLLGVFLPGAARWSRRVGTAARTVVVYTSQDEVYAEPIFREFEAATGIKVRAVFDSEAVKTVGLANRLLAERTHPQCDVFWNNEEFRTRELAARGAFRPTNGWAALGYRSRRIVVNTNLVSAGRAPHSFLDATNAQWRGRVALAYPLFGTTATHFLALRQKLGDAGWQTWCRALAANRPFLVDGNSVVVKMVGAGEAIWGFTDSDDIEEGRHDGWPVAAVAEGEATLLLTNTVGVVRDAPHPEAADALYTYLRTPQLARRLVAAHALESDQPPGGGSPGLRVDWDGLLRDTEVATAALRGIFLR